MASFDAEFFMDSLDPEDCNLPFPDPEPHALSQEQIEFEMFFQSINDLLFQLTSGMSRVNKLGLDPRQEALVNLTRYTLQLLRKSYREHPLYDKCMEEE